MNTRWADIGGTDIDPESTAARLDRAIDDDEIRVHYQPVLDLRGDGCRRLEAMSRWTGERPGVFVRAAELARTVARHDLHILSLVTRDLSQWIAEGRPERVSVNFSSLTMTTPGIAGHVARRIDDDDVDPAHLTIEVTETVDVDPESLIRSMRELREIGVGLSLDGFGTHSSRLELLTRAPIDELKVDRSSIHDHDLDRATATIGSVVALAHDLDLRVVAVGVETAEQAERARSLGCDAAQGHLFGRPVPGPMLSPTMRALDA